MAEKIFKVETLIRLQRATWYVTVVYFTLVVALYLINLGPATTLAYWGVVWILAATVVKLILMAEQFRKAKLPRFWALCYLLVLILASIAVVRYLL